MRYNYNRCLIIAFLSFLPAFASAEIVIPDISSFNQSIENMNQVPGSTLPANFSANFSAVEPTSTAHHETLKNINYSAPLPQPPVAPPSPQATTTPAPILTHSNSNSSAAQNKATSSGGILLSSADNNAATPNSNAFFLAP